LLSLDGEVSADVLASVAEDLTRPGGVRVLVVDDFHLTGQAGTDALALLLEYRPASLQLVVASRVDPQLRLHRMRASQELAELLWRGAFERGSRAFTLAQETGVDPGQQPELAVKLEAVGTLHCPFIGQFGEALAHRHRARSFEVNADGVEDWLVALDALVMYDHTYLGDFTEARQLADAIASAQFSAPLTDVLCPGVISQAA
jgi:hypothetical protein